MNKWWVQCAVEEGQKYFHNLLEQRGSFSIALANHVVSSLA
jgi:hypothetical protein